MTIKYLKKASRTAETGQQDLHDTVQILLSEIEAGGEDSVRHYAQKFDSWEGDIIVSDETVQAAATALPDKLKDDIRFAHDNIRRFAEAQRSTISEFDLEIVPGLIAGQRQIPVSASSNARASWLISPLATRLLRLSQSLGETTLTSAPARNNNDTLRADTSPPPTTKTRLP